MYAAGVLRKKTLCRCKDAPSKYPDLPAMSMSGENQVNPMPV